MKPSRTTRVLLGTLMVLGLVVLGRWSASWGGDAPPDEHAGHEATGVDAPSTPAAPTVWTCPMHPQIRLPDPGDCPICGMDLVELVPGGDDAPRRLVMSPAAKELAKIEVEPVRRAFVTRPVRMTGKFAFDETRVRTISAWVAGRLDRLFVDYTGVRVREGDHLVDLYSPDLLSAQEELLSARQRLVETEGETSTFLTDSNRRAYEAARGKLLLLGLTEAQVDDLERSGSVEDHVMITSPASGVVIEKLLDEGAYVRTGTPIYRIAELDRLWVLLDAYEQDLAWLRHGQPIVLEVEALPGESFEGRVAYIDPFVHDRTRTAKVRVNVENPSGRLKPGMFVRGVAASRLGADGAVVDRHLAGKWVSPMHPEIVKDGPGVCDVCGMDLVRAEELGLVARGDAVVEGALVVPASAVLVTGKRAVVYVEVPDAREPTYEGREIRLGPRAGDEYVVVAGLSEGERVVVHGAFRIDSSMQIRAKPSMMDVAAEPRTAEGPEAVSFRAALRPLQDAYIELHVALAGDDEPAARRAVRSIRTALESISGGTLPAELRETWEEEAARLAPALDAAAEADGLDGVREAFEDVAGAVLTLTRVFGHDGDADLVEVFCPMAFDDAGASWMQVGEDVRNPYFGASMLRCGVVRGPVDER